MSAPDDLPSPAETFDASSFDLAADPDATIAGRIDPGTAAEDGLHFGPPPTGKSERIGEGGMGIVDAVHDPILGRVVAVKRARRAGRHRAALVAEARTLGRLDHPNVVPVHALAVDEDGSPALVMKRVRGQRWSELAGRDLDRDLEILLQVCDALRFAHARGILHRDVKLENVMVGAFGEALLMDWGCACPLAHAVTTEIVGTPAYMAPEMLTVGAPIGPATDVFLLGATLHHALTGAPRHVGGDVRAVLAAAWKAAPAVRDPRVPAELFALIESACARDPAVRPPDVAAFAAGVRAYRAHRGVEQLADRARAAAARLDEALADGSPTADAAFVEARFGFRAALARWPACPGVADALDTLHDRYIAFKLERREVAAVEGLLAELPEARRAVWAPRVAEARAASERMASEWRAGSLTVGGRDRRVMALTLLGLAVAGLMGITAVGVDPRRLTPEDVVATGVVAAAIPAVVLLGLRRRIFAHGISRALGLGVLGVNLLSLLHRVLAADAGVDVATTLRADALLVGGLTLAGAGASPILALPGLPYCAAALACAAWPDQASVLFPAASFGSLLLAVGVFWRR